MESGEILDLQITASSHYDDSNPATTKGRLRAETWVSKEKNADQWLQVDLGRQHTKVKGVATQGSNHGLTQWVTKYKLQYSNNGVNFQYYREQGQNEDKEFAGNADNDGVVYHGLNPPIMARYIRFRPQAWHHWISMRAELFGCQECRDALGMETGDISNGQTSASSQWNANNGAMYARLHIKETVYNGGGWSVGTNDGNQWLQIYLGSQSTKIAAVATQGKNGVHIQWVKTYKLQYGNDGLNVQYYRERGQNADKVFAGNSDQDSVVYHELIPPITARYIIFRPVTWHGHISMRVELYGCKGTKEF
ncbi:EGF-like repeat and discoidin I-like domain-containing protein 3 [Oculina patagonica]